MTKEQNEIEKRTASRHDRRREAVYFIFSLIIVAVLILLAYTFGIVLCPLKRFTGIPCPTCGSTRAMLKVIHGDFASAFALQPLVMMLAIASGPVILATTLFQPVKHLLKMMIRHPLVWFLAALAFVANWIYVIMNGN